MTSPNSADFPKDDKTATALLIAIGLAAAVVTGAALAGSASGVLGFGRSAAIETEQRQQAAAIARIDHALGSVIGDVATITSRAETARNETARDDVVYDRLARLDADVGELRMNLFVAGAAERVREESWRERAAALDADLARNGIDIAALRTSIDGQQQGGRTVLAGIVRRVDRLETLLATGDVTGALPARKARASARHRKRALPGRPLAGWSVTHGEPNFAIVAGEDATFDATPGHIIPGLGRVTAVRQTHNGWAVVTEMGVIAPR